MREQCTYWYNIKFDCKKHDTEQLTYDPNILGKMISMSDEQDLEHFMKAFPPKVQLFEIEDIDIDVGETKVLVPLFKSKLPQAVACYM